MASRIQRKRSRKNPNRNFFILILVILATSLVLAITAGRITSVPDGKVPLEGIDVSNHQGVIDWASIDQGLVNFVFIKATESTEFKDKSFRKNWDEAGRQGFLRGAYHFYDINTDGGAQADNFISTVPREDKTLPPVVDIETIGDNGEQVLEGLKAFVSKVEKHYGKKPILYCNQSTYAQYVKDNFAAYPIWFASYSGEPSVEWNFWQFTDKATIAGIETAVDFNQFNGDSKALLKLGK